jgi:hypothetical protein
LPVFYQVSRGGSSDINVIEARAEFRDNFQTWEPPREFGINTVENVAGPTNVAFHSYDHFSFGGDALF